ncbi:hypothetical protein Leryth_006987 [Lithospermum erythrorhizon]|nr:hypothetical protein Leryth_006987 [Lithospermum erythrorhizon]
MDKTLVPLEEPLAQISTATSIPPPEGSLSGRCRMVTCGTDDDPWERFFRDSDEDDFEGTLVDSESAGQTATPNNGTTSGAAISAGEGLSQTVFLPPLSKPSYEPSLTPTTSKFDKISTSLRIFLFHHVDQPNSPGFSPECHQQEIEETRKQYCHYVYSTRSQCHEQSVSKETNHHHVEPEIDVDEDFYESPPSQRDEENDEVAQD